MYVPIRTAFSAGPASSTHLNAQPYIRYCLRMPRIELLSRESFHFNLFGLLAWKNLQHPMNPYCIIIMTHLLLSADTIYR